MNTTARRSISSALTNLLGPEQLLPAEDSRYLQDETEGRGVVGFADAITLPRSAEEVAAVMSWCYEHGVALVPRGGGTGFAGGAVPIEGGVILALERLVQIRGFDPLLWRIHVEAGVPTAAVRRMANEHGLLFPPDPGAAEQSQIGGNIATNAGGPHAFKYGVTGAWVTGLEAVVPPGDVITVGGPIRKDVAGYDLKSLLIGSEGTLGVITAAWLRLIPRPEASFPVTAVYANAASGCAAIERVLGSGLMPAALEYLDASTALASGAAFPHGLPPDAGFVVLTEADGSLAGAHALREELVEALHEDASLVFAPKEGPDIQAVWRWRDGISIAVTARLGGKVSEDIVVPLDRLQEAIEETLAIGQRHGLEACSWGHAGDGNLHSTFMLGRDDTEALERAAAAANELFALATRLGGSVSGEHGIGWVKRGQLRRQWSPRALELHAKIKRAWDPRGLLNPGKKV
jgi:glycolate oxidase subunit GlcD